jgi:hypothetical protein
MNAFLLALLLATGPGFDAGMKAYAEGRHRDAFLAFDGARRDAGDEASPELLYNLALAAVRCGELEQAQAAAEEAATRGGPDFAARREFLLGNIAFARCEESIAEMNQPEALLSALDSAIAHADIAKSSWQRAALARSGWPEARRNVERALLLEGALKRRKEAEARKKAKTPEIRPRLEPKAEEGDDEEEDPGGKGKETEEEATIEAQKTKLSPEEVRLLLDRLVEKEKEKRALRRARKPTKVPVEKDW